MSLPQCLKWSTFYRYQYDNNESGPRRDLNSEGKDGINTAIYITKACGLLTLVFGSPLQGHKFNARRCVVTLTLSKSTLFLFPLVGSVSKDEFIHVFQMTTFVIFYV